MIISNENLKTEALENKNYDYLYEAIDLCKPEKVTVLTDSIEDIEYVRALALKIMKKKSSYERPYHPF